MNTYQKLNNYFTYWRWCTSHQVPRYYSYGGRPQTDFLGLIVLCFVSRCLWSCRTRWVPSRRCAGTGRSQAGLFHW